MANLLDFASGIKKPSSQNTLGLIYNSAPSSKNLTPSLQSSINLSLLIGTDKPMTLEEFINLSQCLCRSGIVLLYTLAPSNIVLPCI